MKIMGDKDFMKFFLLRSIDPFWKTLVSIQTNIKARLGIGKSFKVIYTADLKT